MTTAFHYNCIQHSSLINVDDMMEIPLRFIIVSIMLYDRYVSVGHSHHRSSPASSHFDPTWVRRLSGGRVVLLVMVSGANVNKTTCSNDHTVLSLACNNGHLDIVRFLLRSAADFTHRLKVHVASRWDIDCGRFVQLLRLCSLVPELLSDGSKISFYVFVYFCHLFVAGLSASSTAVSCSLKSHL